AVFELVASGKPLGTFPFFYTEASVLWDNVATGWPLAVLLRDANDNIVDFVCGYGADPAGIKNPFPIPHSEWIGNSVAANINTSLTLQRVGSLDHNDNTDWVAR